MTRPGEVIPPAPGWWPRTARVGVGAAGYGWAVSAVGVSDHLGEVATGYGFSGTATGVAAPPPVAYTAVGASGGSGSFSFDGPDAGTGDTVICFIATDGAGTTTVTYGGVSMRHLGYAGPVDRDSYRVYLQAFDIADVDGGVETVAVTDPGAWCSAQAVSYENVGAVAIAEAVTGTGTSLSQSVTVPAYSMYTQAFIAPNPSGSSKSLSSVSGGTNRWNRTGATYVPVHSVSDADENATFTATFDSGDWAGLAVPLLPADSAPILLDNIGPGQAPDSSGALSLTHNVLTAGADIFVDVMTDRDCAVSSATCAGSAMTLIGGPLTYASSRKMFRYRATNQSAGSKTISVSLTNVPWVWGNSVSLLNVTSVGTADTDTGSSSQPSHSVTCSAGEVILDAIASSTALTQILDGGIGLWYTGAASLGGMQRLATSSTTFSTEDASDDWGALANVIS